MTALIVVLLVLGSTGRAIESQGLRGPLLTTVLAVPGVRPAVEAAYRRELEAAEAAKPEEPIAVDDSESEEDGVQPRHVVALRREEHVARVGPAVEIAELLDAVVQGDDGEEYRSSAATGNAGRD
jgi:hypothetical protein